MGLGPGPSPGWFGLEEAFTLSCKIQSKSRKMSAEKPLPLGFCAQLERRPCGSGCCGAVVCMEEQGRLSSF